MGRNNLTFNELPSILNELILNVSNIEFDIRHIINHCKIFGEMFDHIINININDVLFYNRNIEILMKLINVVEIHIQLIKSCAQIVQIEDDEEEEDGNVISEYEKRTVAINNFMNIKRECPICYNDFPTGRLIFAPCSHCYCMDCFEKFENIKCPMCMLDIPICIKYEINGDNLKYSTILMTENPTYYDFQNFDRIIRQQIE